MVDMAASGRHSSIALQNLIAISLGWELPVYDMKGLLCVCIQGARFC